MEWIDIKTGLLDLLYPAAERCALCGAGEDIVPGTWLCRRCLQEALRHEGILCPCCGRQTDRPGRCFNCRDVYIHYRQGAVVFHYEGALREAMIRLKFHGDLSLVCFFGAWMARCLHEREWPRPQVLVPVPSHRLRRLGRGFNLPGRLAGEVSRLTGIPVCHGALRRTTMGAMPGKSRQERQERAGKAFVPGDGSKVRDRRVLLIDDITTTGATLNVCARHLMDMGAASVHVMAAAGGVN